MKISFARDCGMFGTVKGSASQNVPSAIGTMGLYRPWRRSRKDIVPLMLESAGQSMSSNEGCKIVSDSRMRAVTVAK